MRAKLSRKSRLMELQRAGYPDCNTLHRGFDLTGPLNPGAGWLPRTDGRYEAPISMNDFYVQNRKYVQEKVMTAKPSPHWEVMFAELVHQRRRRAEYRADSKLPRSGESRRERPKGCGSRQRPHRTLGGLRCASQWCRATRSGDARTSGEAHTTPQ